MKKLRITVEGKVYEVVVEMVEGDDLVPARSRAPETQGAVSPLQAVTMAAPVVTASTGADAPAGAVPSPLAGKVVSIQVQAGQQIAKGEQLLTIEAMKMNTFINAPADGRVGKILVAPGDAVEEGQGLVVLE